MSCKMIWGLIGMMFSVAGYGQGTDTAGAPAGVAVRSGFVAVPRVVTTPPSIANKVERLRGVSHPWPGNVSLIAEQGAWYSPMFQPGMTGRYDIRRLHAAAK